jgi:glycolate oxidase iron-sulfur subunit
MAVASARDPIDDCVHCGFCLPTCPTYVSWGEEMDSPRGRIDLMKGLRDRQLRLDDTVVRHFDRCLGCMACVTACPSGVRYDLLIETTRATVEEQHPRRRADRWYRRLVFALLVHPARLRLIRLLLLAYVYTGLYWLVHASRLVRLLPRRWQALEALVPPLGRRAPSAGPPLHTPARGAERARVGLVSGCVQHVFFPEVNAATVRVLAAEGCAVTVPPRQGCCGALSLHAGREPEARQLVRALIKRFESEKLDAVVVNSAGCGSHLKSCARLFAGEPAWQERARAFGATVRDVSEQLAALPPTATRHPLPLTVAYHDACHLGHAQGIRAQPRALLSSIPGLTIKEIPDGEQCCGSAGIYNLVEPASADEIGARKAAAVASVGAELLASANPGCTLQLRKLLRARGVALAAAHPIEILDASLRGDTRFGRRR